MKIPNRSQHYAEQARRRFIKDGYLFKPTSHMPVYDMQAYYGEHANGSVVSIYFNKRIVRVYRNKTLIDYRQFSIT